MIAGGTHPRRTRRPVVGATLGLIGAVHVALTPLIYPSSVDSIVQHGVIASVEADPELVPLRGLAFWYATSGLGVIALGTAMADLERRELLRRRHAAMLGVIGLWGTLLVPKSGFWLFLPLAALAAARTGETDGGSTQRRREVSRLQGWPCRPPCSPTGTS